MSTTRFTGRSLSRWARNSEQSLLRNSQSSSISTRRACSTINVNLLRQSQCIKSWRMAQSTVHINGRSHIPASSRRNFSSSAIAMHGHLDPPKPGEELHITFIDKDGDETTLTVAKGDNLLDIAQANDVEMEGACGGSCACSTCHVIVEDEDLYEKMDEPDDDENDMLDLAFGLTETSRLGCQVKMSKELDGLRVRLPSMTRNLQASDFSKKNERSD